VQHRDSPISTCFNKDTYFVHIVFVPVIFVISLFTLFVLVVQYCRSFILFIVQLLFVLLFDSFFFNSFFFNSFFSILLLLSFVVLCFKEKGSILILNCVQVFQSRCSSTSHHLFDSINIIQQTPSTLSLYRSEGPISFIDIAG
jgi:hypothetical protein